jgi:hypothetical protein
MTMEIKNRTPFVAGWTTQLDKQAAEHLVMAVRGTWTFDERGRLSVMREPPPLLPADDHVGEPGVSSIRYEADIGPMKVATDCALVGSAMASKGRASKVDVSFRVGTVTQRAIVTGERRRVLWMGKWWLGPVRSFDRVPLLWELAVGGTDTTPKNESRHSLDLRNPLGRGFRARGSKLPKRGALLPQILATKGGAKRPVGFGLTGGQWAHRRPFAGTYDDAWRDERCPLLPEDFDERFHSNAAPGLTTKTHLVGGEPVEVLGCTRSGKLTFRLPKQALDVQATIAGAAEPIEMKLVTVTVDTDARQLRMLWRGSLNVHQRLMSLERIDVRDPVGSARDDEDENGTSDA